ncbi:hypothetical protein QYM36_011080, partial [Artemia franciscana]
RYPKVLGPNRAKQLGFTKSPDTSKLVTMVETQSDGELYSLLPYLCKNSLRGKALGWERAVEAHHRELERVNAAREMERVGVGDMRGREERMRDIAAEQAVQQHFEESLRRAGANQKQ